MNRQTTASMIIFIKHITAKRLVPQLYNELPQSKIKRQTIQLKMAKYFNRHFTKENIEMFINHR